MQDSGATLETTEHGIESIPCSELYRDVCALARILLTVQKVGRVRTLQTIFHLCVP